MNAFGQHAAFAPAASTAVTPMPAAKELPYDYVARFQLRGQAGNRVQDVINVSVEGAFVAVAIGYSFIPARTTIRSAASNLIDFKYSIVDSASGRELQNQPIHNIAGLGEAGGNRPFRPFAKPALFLPRSTIRVEVEEISVGPDYNGAELYMVLHGYKILGYGAGPQ
jgi:hypothetical protein